MTSREQVRQANPDDSTQSAPELPPQRGASVVLLATFFLVYFGLGCLLAPFESVYDFFGADMWDDLNRGAELRHVLVPLFLKPVTAVVSRLGGAVPVQVAAINAGFGALAVVLSHRVFLLLVRQARAAFLLALLYGVSMSQMVFSSVPETYAIGATGIALTYLVFLGSLRTRRVGFLRWFAVALWTIGITTSNIAQTAVAYVAAARASIGTRRALRGMVLALTLLTAVPALIHVQTRALDTQQLLSLGAAQDEANDFLRYVGPEAAAVEEGEGVPYPPVSEVRSIRLLAANYVMLAFVGGEPGRLARDQDRLKIEYVGHPLRYSLLGLVTVALWLVLWLAGVTANVRATVARDRWPPSAFLGALAIIIAGNLVLFTIYNPFEMYLYSLLTAFPILLAGVNGELVRSRKWMALTAALVVLMAWNNVDIITSMIEAP